MECPFCNISKEGRTLKEGKLARVILSNPRLMPGHLLVIPKRHITKISEITKEERDEIFDLLLEFQQKITSMISTGCDIRQNYKPYLKEGRTHVDHVHFHLMPREFEDELHEKDEKSRKILYRDLSEEEKEEITDILK